MYDLLNANVRGELRLHIPRGKERVSMVLCSCFINNSLVCTSAQKKIIKK